MGIFNVLGRWNQYIPADDPAAATNWQRPGPLDAGQGLVNLARSSRDVGDYPALFAGADRRDAAVAVVYLSFSGRCRPGLTAGTLITGRSLHVASRPVADVEAEAVPPYAGPLNTGHYGNGLVLPLDGKQAGLPEFML